MGRRRVKVTFVEALGGFDERGHDLVALDDALAALAAIDERKVASSRCGSSAV
jgi:hypothetical protein